MFSHVMVGSNDLNLSQRFYDVLFGSLGNKPGRIDAYGRLVYARQGALFMVTTPINGQPASHANGGTVGFLLANPDEVNIWHEAGIGGGGESIEDPPGERPTPFGPIYLAYLRDPDGNKLCGLHRLTWPRPDPHSQSHEDEEPR